jgi:predicted nucleic-acid-binding Zn-ribbon protein
MFVKCPKCANKFEIKNPISAKGGSKSKRILTPEQSKEMLRIRELKRKNKKQA